MINYQKEIKQAKEADEPLPIIPEYIGECFLKIANRLSFRPNFINYAFREDMISDGIENCIQYMNNFNPEKSSNPFAYFTQIIYYAFIRRIQKEKKQLYIKYKTMDTQAAMSENVEISQNDTEQRYSYETMTQDQKVNMYNFISNFEESKKKKKETAKKKTTKVDDSTNLELIMSV
jgi:DNA-directed RNA polymerase specialized sigma24 family protein